MEERQDLISRQVAIDALRDAENHAFNSFYKGLAKAHKIIADLPSVQPDHVANISKKVEGDCISRQMAIDAMKDALDPHIVQFVKSKMAIEALPSAQPEPHWIPCSERLPENEYVLISKKPTMISGDKWSVAIAVRMADPRSGKIQWRDSGFGVIQDDKVLAWMPMPIPYCGGYGE